MSQLRARHVEGDGGRSGVDVLLGQVGDMEELGIFEAFRVSRMCRLFPAIK